MNEATIRHEFNKRATLLRRAVCMGAMTAAAAKKQMHEDFEEILFDELVKMKRQCKQQPLDTLYKKLFPNTGSEEE